ncbi:hypothetical protein [Flavobacterium filum]|uniref:hypothetical protein n=1 Tax=Flavobacterium filum TaxID=370974 RepID=UPI0023F0EAC6|nr:hypothetical protein [Flavobacterium filum]
MSKIFKKHIERYDYFVDYYFSKQKQGNYGDILPYQVRPQSAHFFVENKDGTFDKISIQSHVILDMAKVIQELSEQIVEMEYTFGGGE